MGDQRTNVTGDRPSYWGGIGLGCCGVMLVLLVGNVVIGQIRPLQGVDLGDAYEGLGALFSGLAFIGVLYALKYQRDELEDQRKAIVQQQTEMEAQSFETSFFQL